MGGHVCDFCTYDRFHSHKNIFVPGPDVTYVAPEAIVHYVGCHRYCPPNEFSEALVNAPPADSSEYFAALHANGWPPMVAHPTAVDPKWQRRVQVETVLQARGEAIVAAVEAFRETHGVLPGEIGDALGLGDDTRWDYHIKGVEYCLVGRSDIEGVRVSRLAGLPVWICSYDADA
jgi:hypothetical protein